MCKLSKNGKWRIDPCMKNLVDYLKDGHYSTRASCCGHGKYPITCIVEFRQNGIPVFKELFSDKIIPRTKRFYKKDKQGYYYIPETISRRQQ